MIKLKDLLKETQLKSFFDIKNEMDPNGTHHDLRLTCAKCGTSETCKCMKPKREFTGLCHKCAGIDYRGNKLINENIADYNTAADFHERYNEQLINLAMLLKNSHGKGKVPWKTIPANLLKQVWLQFGKYNKIDINKLDKISDQILTNIARLRASTAMLGHTGYNVRSDLEDDEIVFTDKEWEDWMSKYFTDNRGQFMLSDYGLPKLERIYSEIFNAKTPEDKLYAIDKALNVIHQRGDLAAMFVEGGTSTLNIIANQGGYTSNI